MRGYPGGQYSPDLVQKYAGSAYDLMSKIQDNLPMILEAGRSMGHLTDVLFFRFTAMSNQTVFQGDDLTGRPLLVPGSLPQVYVERILQDTASYVVENAGATVRFLVPPTAGAEVLISGFSYNPDGSIYFDPILSQDHLVQVVADIDAAALLATTAASTVAGSVSAAAVSANAAANSQSAALLSQQAAEAVQLYVESVESNLPLWRGPWATATVYESGDLVREGGSTYIALLPHTAGTFADDLTANRWTVFAAQGASGAGTGDMLAANNLSDLANPAAAIANLGLGTAATQASTAFATAAQGLLADAAAPLAAPIFSGRATIPMTTITGVGGQAVSLSATDPVLLIGGVTGQNLAIDQNTIQARNNGAASVLELNVLGGNVALGDNVNSILHLQGKIQGLAVATSGQADAGSANDVIMTPLRVVQQINARVGTVANAAAMTYGIGWQQAWYAVSRTKGTSYQNVTGKPILVSAQVTGDAGPMTIEVTNESQVLVPVAVSGTGRQQLSAIVPQNKYYRISGNGVLHAVSELR